MSTLSSIATRYKNNYTMLLIFVYWLSTLTVIQLIMEKSEIKYSLKNIPTPSKESYRLNVVDKIKSLVKRMTWRAFYYLNQ